MSINGFKRNNQYRTFILHTNNNSIADNKFANDRAKLKLKYGN